METANTRRQTQRLSLQWTEGITGAKTCLLNTSSLFVVRSQPEWEEKWSGGGGGSRWRWGRVGRGRGENAPRRLLEAANDEACEPQLSSLLSFFLQRTYVGPICCRFARGSACPRAERKKGKKERQRGKSSRLLGESGHLISGLARGRG